MPGKVLRSAREKLRDEAVRLKKAWIVGLGWRGGEVEPGKYVRDLRSDVVALLQLFTPCNTREQQARAIHWFCSQFERWKAVDFGIVSLCTVAEFERSVGTLKTSESIDRPAYGELLRQGFGPSVAIRHPEYMLARDLAFLYGLFLDAEALLGSTAAAKGARWRGSSGENSQALARTVIITCFNLLESFVAGLAQHHVMTQRGLESAARAKLLDARVPLRKRLLQIPELIVSRSNPLRGDDSPLIHLFDVLKRRRDAFVHCEPGPQVSERAGYVKEVEFHAVDRTVVDEAVDKTYEVIRRSWQFVYGAAGPHWLPARDNGGRFQRHDLRLTAPS